MQHNEGIALPMPDAASAAQSERCAGYIRERIRDAGGSISFAEFMHYALYARGLGYYSAGTRKFGSGGDFVTAPEISAVFTRVLARQCAAVLQHMGDGSVLEFGAGSGRLAVDLLSALTRLGQAPREYRILEVSADLRERQQRLLRDELDQEIGAFEAEFLIDFFAEEVGAYFYNRGLYAAQSLFSQKIEEFADTLYELELPTNFRK